MRLQANPADRVQMVEGSPGRRAAGVCHKEVEMPTSEELLEIAKAAASRISIEGFRRYPTFADVEQQCGDEYDGLLDLLQEDELFAPVDLELQEQLIDTLKTVLPASKHKLLEELADNCSRHVWLQQEAAFHVGMAVGMRLAGMSTEES
jgi:hypothetical protein